MSLAQRVGQLLMVDCPSTSITDAALSAIRQNAVGAVILDGNSELGRSATAQLTAQLQQSAPKTVGLLIATDQEGGEVRRLRGSGFTAMPSAVVQGQLAPSALQSQAVGWGHELRSAGVNLDLAPVLDTVPSGFGSNPPIGDLERNYGTTPSAVSSHGLAVAAGFRQAGVLATAKHFPGLGRVHGNTDVTSGVTDTVTTASDAYLQPFKDAVAAKIPLVMISTAIYQKIDPGTPAAFSARIVNGLLRGTLGYRGVVISDDLGAAQQVAGVPVGTRAVDFVAAGGDIVLTVVPGQAATMTAALMAKAQQDPSFRKLVDAAALRVLELKLSAGLLH